MPDSAPARTGWVLPVLLAVATSAALGFGFLYLTRPNAGDLGVIRVVVTDDAGKSASAIRVTVAEAPLIQKEVVSPGPEFKGEVHYPEPFLTRPNLKVLAGQRRYQVTTETELGFTWVARPLPGDFREDAEQDTNVAASLLGLELAAAAAQGKLKPGLVFEDFTWEAKGLRAPPSAIPFPQSGTFQCSPGKEGQVFFPLPYDSPPNVVLSGGELLECTAQGFKWRNSGSFGHEERWTAKGVRSGAGREQGGVAEPGAEAGRDP
jgi:hypothetical protein